MPQPHGEGLKTAIVTGATGAIGPGLVQALMNSGYSVRALVRHHNTTLLPQNVQTIAGDLCDRRAIEQAITGADVVFHLAARLHADTQHASADVRKEYQRVNVQATQDLATLARERGVRRFVFFSTIAVYGASLPGQILNEQSPVTRHTLYTETKLAAEDAALGAPGAVVLRLAATYGPRVKGNYLRLVEMMRRGIAVRIGSGQNRRTLVHQQDVEAAAILAARQAPPGSIYNVTDGRIHTVESILAAMAAALHRRPVSISLPARPFRMIAGALEDTFRLAGRRSPIGRATIDKLLEDVAVSGDRIQHDLGFAPAVDLTTGWRLAVGG